MKAFNIAPSAGMKHFISVALVMLLMIVSAWQLRAWMDKSSTMPIKYVRVEGQLTNLPQEEITKALSPLVKAGYFTLDSEGMVNKVQDLAWVREARIRRVWPDTIVVSVVEQNPVAVWNESHMLNEQGDVFKPSGDVTSFGLPLLAGVEEKKRDILLVKEKVDASIRNLDLSVKQLSLAEHGSWSVVLNNGVTLMIGNKAPENEVSKSLRVLASLDRNLIGQAQVMDLRYPNGVAVTWKEGFVLGKPSEKKQSFVVNKEQPKEG